LLNEYDPDRAPDAEAWRAGNEMQLVELVQAYHRASQIPLPNERVHAALHVMVENQVALGDKTPVAAAVARLMGEGMSRHDALHAVGAVLDKHVNRAHATQVPVSRDAYYDDIRGLTKDGWFAEFGLNPPEQPGEPNDPDVR
jgi:hypothetical protein